MSLASRVNDLATSVATQIKALRASVGAVAGPPRLYRIEGRLTSRVVGTNIYDLVLSDNYNPVRRLTTTEVRARLDAAVAMGANMIRTHAWISYGQTDSIMPTLGNYNEAALVALDVAIAEARKRKLWLMAPMVDRWNYYHGGAVTFAKLVNGGSLTDDQYRTLFFTDTNTINQFKTYLTTTLTRVNTVTGIRYVDDPTLAIIENINEGYDAPQAWSATIFAHLRTIAPNTLLADGVNALQSRHPDGTNTEGYSNPGYNSLTMDCDIVGGHFYNDRNGGYLDRDAAMAFAAGKAYIVGEWGWTDTVNGTTVLMGGLSRAQFMARMEANQNVSGSLFWSLHTGASGNVHDDGYQMFYPPFNNEQRRGMDDLTRHAWKMRESTGKPWFDLLNGVVQTAFSDTFDGTGAVSATKWGNYTYGTGASVTTVSGVATFVTGTAGGYGAVPQIASKAPAALNRRVRFDVTPTTTAEAYFRVPLRAQSAAAADGVFSYVLEINGSGAWNIARKTSGGSVVLGPADGASQIAGWAANVSQSIEFEVIGSTINLRIWLTTNGRPVVPTWSSTDVAAAAIMMPGITGLALNNGASTTSNTWRVDNYTITDFPDGDGDTATVFPRGTLLMQNGTMLAEPYSDANPPESLMMTERTAMGEPSTPPSGRVVLYSIDGSALLLKDDSGVVRTVGSGGGGSGTKVSALPAVTTLVDTDVVPIVNGGATKTMTLNQLVAYSEQRARQNNASVANQTGFSSDTYLVGSSIPIPNGRLQAKSMYRLKFAVTKSAAGTATPIVNIRFGTLGTTSDTSRLTFTFAAQTAAVDTGFFEIHCTFRTVGSGVAVLTGVGLLDHTLATTGLSTVNTSILQVTGSAFDSTPNGSMIGASVSGGTSASWTVQLVQAELQNLA